MITLANEVIFKMIWNVLLADEDIQSFNTFSYKI